MNVIKTSNLNIFDQYAVSSIVHFPSIIYGTAGLKNSSFECEPNATLDNAILLDVKPQFLLNVKNAEIYGDARFILDKDVWIAHENIDWAHRNKNYEFSPSPVSHVSQKLHLSGNTLVLEGTWSTEYYHFMAETLGKIYVAQRFMELSKFDHILVNLSNKKYIAEWLDILGLSEKVIEPKGRIISCDNLYIPSHASPCGWVSNDYIDWLRAKVRFETNNDFMKDIYISRSGKRKISNEVELIPIFDKHGYQVVRLEEHTVIEQASIFSSSKNIIAPHGAGLINLIFAQRGTSLLEFFGGGYVNPCFGCLAVALDMRYFYHVAGQSILDVENLHQDYRVDPIVLDEAIKKMAS